MLLSGKEKTGTCYEKALGKGYVFIAISCFVLITAICACGHVAFDNDTYFILATGRDILQNGIPFEDRLLMHPGLEFQVELWLTSVIFWKVYSLFGVQGLVILAGICQIAVAYALFLMYDAFGGKRKNSLCLYFVLFIYFACFLRLRPQMFSTPLFIVLTYLLERKNYRIVPILSALIVNLHAGLWFIGICIIGAFAVDDYLQRKYRSITLVLLAYILAGFCNPYGYKALVFIFPTISENFYFDKIIEMKPLTFRSSFSFASMVYMSLIWSGYRIAKDKITVRSILLFWGFSALSLISIRGFVFYLAVGIPAFLSQCREFAFSVKLNGKYLKRYFSALFCIWLVLHVCFTDKFLIIVDPILREIGDPPKTVFHSRFEIGSQLDFLGHKPYWDPRLELLYKSKNKKLDIYKEVENVRAGLSDVVEFLEKYKFDFVLTEKESDVVERFIGDDRHYQLYRESERYRLYKRQPAS